MFGHGQWFATYIVHIILYGFRHGTGDTILTGGDHGDQYITMTIMRIGDHLGDITLYAIPTEWFMRTIYTRHIELLP